MQENLRAHLLANAVLPISVPNRTAAILVRPTRAATRRWTAASMSPWQQWRVVADSPPASLSPPFHRRPQAYLGAGITDLTFNPNTNRIISYKARPEDIPENTLGLAPFYVTISQARSSGADHPCRSSLDLLRRAAPITASHRADCCQRAPPPLHAVSNRIAFLSGARSCSSSLWALTSSPRA